MRSLTVLSKVSLKSSEHKVQKDAAFRRGSRNHRDNGKNEPMNTTKKVKTLDRSLAEGTTIGRRSFIAGAATATVPLIALSQSRDYGNNGPQVRYPDPDILVLDTRFGKYKVGNAAIQRLYTGMRWAEGPAWSGTGGYLVWSDIPNNVQHRWVIDDGHVSVVRNPSNFSNGNTFDWEGRQLSCEHATRRV